ncbi:MAG: CsbD family protein [Pyrinomonadaceae bacterium]
MGTVKEEAGGMGDRISGGAKEAWGKVTGDESLKNEGAAQADYGKERQANNDVVDSSSTSTGKSGMVTGMFRDRDSAEKAYNSTLSRGYTKDDVNLLMSDDTRKKYFNDETADTELGSKALEGAGTGGAIGGTLGAIIAGIAAIGTSVLIPGLGLIVAGPLAAALAGAGAGGLTGGLVGALIGSGIPEERAKVYDEGVRNGGIVMGVNPRTDEDATYFENEWRNNRGEHVYR